jgi:hypothetical protein
VGGCHVGRSRSGYLPKARVHSTERCLQHRPGSAVGPVQVAVSRRLLELDGHPHRGARHGEIRAHFLHWDVRAESVKSIEMLCP